MREKKYFTQKGQTLVALLFFMVITITIVSAAVVAIFVNVTSTGKMQGSEAAYYIAESGAEEALINLLRNPTYSGGTIAVGEGEAVITVNGDDPKNIRSSGTVGNHKRTIEVMAGYTDNILRVLSWNEVIL